MRPTTSQPHCNDLHAKGDQNGIICPPPLKLNRDSHMIMKKSSSSSSSSPPPPPSSSSQHHRHPVIIYTHSPKIIHTSPKDFMALVQKLTGLSGSNNEEGHRRPTNNITLDHQNNNNNNALSDEDESNKNVKNVNSNNMTGNDDNESSSVITSEENCSGGPGGGGGGSGGEGQVNSCFVPAPPIFETPPPNHYLGNNYPIFNPNSANFLCTNPPPFYNYTTDSLFFAPKMRGSISASSQPDNHHHHHHHHQGMDDFHEY